MTVPASQPNRYSYAGNGVTTDFAYSARFLADADLVVVLVNDTTGVETTKTLTTDYTVAGAGTSAGTVTMGTAPASGETLVIYCDPTISQLVDPVNGDALDVDTVIEAPLDKITIICRRLKDLVTRSVRLSDGDTSGVSVTLPTPEANNMFGWNAAGTAIVNYALQAGTSLVDLATSAGASFIGFIQSGTGAVLRTVQAKLRETISVTDFGAVGDGATDDTTAIQAAIDYVESLGGGTLWFPFGTFLISSTLTIQKGVLLRGENQIQDSTSSSGAATGTVIRWNSVTSSDMIQIKSATAGNYLRGAGCINIVGHGGSAAKCFIRASSIMHCEFDLVVQACTEGGLIIDNDNGVLCGLNKIPRFEYIYGSVAAVEGSHGLVLDGDVDPSLTSGVTHNLIGSVTGLIKNGDLIYMRDCDGNIVQHVQCSRASGGTGHAISFRNGSLRHARNNMIGWAMGPVLAESSTRGNNILNLHSEAVDLQIDSGGQLHYNTIDYINAEQWQTHRFVMSDQLLLVPSDFSTAEEYIAAVTYDPASLADGAGVETDVTVTGAILGDIAEASFSLDTQGINLDAQVTATNTVTVRFQNETGAGPIDLLSGTIRVRVKAHPTRASFRGAAGDLWDSVAFDQDYDTSARASVHAPYHWNDGNITGVKLTFCMSGANTTDQARMRIRAATITAASSLSTPEVDESVDITVNDSALRVQEYTHTFVSALAFVKGQYIGLRIGRTGNHANDTAAGTLHLLGVHLIYEGEGPDSSGSGPYDQSPTGV